MTERKELPKTMKALVAYGKGDYRLELEYPVPECGPDDIMIKTEACGICAGDLKCSHGAAMFWGDETQPAWVKPPFIPGHEFFGHIVQMGENVKGYQLGDRIIADQIVPCGTCRFCRDGHYWMCQPHNIFGFQSTNNGGMAEYVRFPKNAVISRVPVDMTIEEALLIEPYGCSKQVGHFLRTVQYMPSFSALCSCVCSRLTFPALLFWHKQGNTLTRQSLGHTQRRTPYSFGAAMLTSVLWV